MKHRQSRFHGRVLDHATDVLPPPPPRASPPRARRRPPLGRQRADRDAHHPAPVEHGGRQVGGAGAVDALGPGLRVAVERVAVEPGRLVPHAHGLQRHRREHPPAGRRGDLLRQPARVVEVAPQPLSASPLTPCSRIRHQSFSARKRRPSGMPQSRRFFTPPSTDDLQVARVGATSRAPGARDRARSRASSRTPRRATCAG